VFFFTIRGKRKSLVHYEKAASLKAENITFQKNLADFYYAEMSGRIKPLIYIKRS